MRKFVSWMLPAIGILAVVFIVIWLFIGGYIMKSVGDTEIGVKLVRNRVVEVLPSGIYTDLRFFTKLKTVNVAKLDWCAVDPEILTSDSQRIGLAVCGTVQRPLDSEAYINGWSSYKPYYTNDNGLAGKFHFEPTDDPTEQRLVIDQSGLMQTQAQQAMKVCVGDRAFSESVIGSARDDLRQCIDEEVSKLLAGFGNLNVDNVVAPNVVLLEEVQQALDNITKSRFEQALAEQDKEKIRAEKEKELEEIQGNIRVTEGEKQEQARQDAITAELKANALLSQQDVIRQQMENDLLQAELQIDVNTELAKAAEIKAEANNADNLYMAELLENNPSYAYMLWLKEIVPA